MSESEVQALVAEVESRARRVETPCSEGTMVWRVWGPKRPDAPPLVLGHGSHGNWSHWIRNIDALATDYTVIVPDLPGHGDSAMPDDAEHESISAAIAAGLRELLAEGQQADLIGFSFGGAVFAQFAVRYPALVRRVIVVGAGGLDTPHGPVNIGRLSGLRGEERRAMLKSNLLGLMLHHPETVDELALHLLVANARQARLPVVGLVAPDRVVEVLPDLKVPLDAIWGEYDRPHPHPEVQEAVLRRYQPDLDFRVIADAGHWAMYERPQAFNAAILDMLRQPLREMR